MFNPPHEKNDIDDLFVNRDDDLAHGVEFFYDHISLTQIHVIHGHSRMGKSHYLKRLINRLKQKKLPFLFYDINANSKQRARIVLNDIFDALKKEIFAFNPELHGVQKDTPAMQHISVAKDMLIDISSLVTGEREQMVCTQMRERIVHNQTTFSLLPKFIQAIWQSGEERKIGEEKQWMMSGLSNENVIELIKYQADLLMNKLLPDEKKSILLTVDDLDLLYVKPGGDEAVMHLLTFLNQLASESLFNILVTMRTEAFHDRQKDMTPFRKIGLLDDIEIKDIYHKHLECFNSSQPIFSDQAIDFLLECADGCIGDFLKNCHSIFNDNFGWYKKGNLIDVNEIKNHVEKNISEHLRFRETKSLMLEIINWVKKEKKQEFSTNQPIIALFLDRILTRDSDQPDRYYINPLYLNVIKEYSKNNIPIST
jgi:hypothetical protein